MGNYGFKDRQTALKVKSLVEAGSASGASVPGNVFDEQGGLAIYNGTGKTIPPFGLVFYGNSNASNIVGTSDYPAVPVSTYRAIKDQHNYKSYISKNWVFNNGAPVEPNQFGWAQARDINCFGFDRGSGGITPGTHFRPSQYYDFELEYGIAEGGDPGFRAFSVRSGRALGASDNERVLELAVPYGNESNPVTMASASYRSSEYDGDGAIRGLFEINAVDAGNAAGVAVGDIVRVLLASNYPIREGAKAIIMSWGSGFTTSSGGGGIGSGTTTSQWVLVDLQLLECENPDGGDGGTGPGGLG